MNLRTLAMCRLPETARLFLLTTATLVASVLLASVLVFGVHALHLAASANG